MPDSDPYPERLMIHYGGTLKTVFLGCLKLFSLYLFATATFVIAPSYLWGREELLEQNVMLGTGVFLAGLIPLVFVTYTTAPYVTQVHVRLPLFARRSRDILDRYTRALPPDAELELTTLRLSGRLRATRVKVREMYVARGPLGIANLARRAPPRKTMPDWSRWREWSWWRDRWAVINPPPSRFYVDPNGRGLTREPGIWENVMGCIRRNGDGGGTSTRAGAGAGAGASPAATRKDRVHTLR
ncbi:MAG: hypothetical protein M1826_003564 [Phylliscum demangeonii]|nr:MAG: hypothetical protein M1826_003564 [Phylliscum demangeonii]